MSAVTTSVKARAVAVGIDVAEPGKGLDLVAMAADRSIVVSQGRLSVESTLTIIAAERPLVVCIDSPSGWATSGKSRRAERELAAIGIQSFRTGPDPGPHPFYKWIRVGLALYARLSADYSLNRGGNVTACAAEVFPHATAVLLAGHLPGGVNKVLFRRRVLRDNGVDEACLPTLDRVDAALGALTGVIALAGSHSVLGDPDEGVILLPIPRVPQTPLHASGATNVASRSATTTRARRSSSSTRVGATVQIGYVNRNGQTVVAATGLSGTDHGQSVYRLRCGHCSNEYGSNGSDNFQRKCPSCQGGALGLPYI